MRLGLFGKILAAFWLALIALGFVLSLFSGATPFEDRPVARLAPSFVHLLERTLSREGPAVADAARLQLEGSIRDRISITPATQAEPPSSRRPLLRRLAIAPDGQRYVIIFYRDRVERFSNLSMTALVGGILAGVLFSVWLARYLNRPLEILRNGFESAARGHLDIRVQPAIGKRGDEIGSLARDFDLMAERLGQLVAARDRLLHDVSHELRSPLTRLQLAIGLARQDPSRLEASLERIEREAGKLEQLVQELLTLARTESGDEFSHFFDPAGVIVELLADAELEAASKGCHIAFLPCPTDADTLPVIAGSAELFHRAVENVVRNAIRFSPVSGTVTVSLSLTSDMSAYRVEVSDEGPGVAPEMLDRLFDPFVRADSNGTGLGLAIANRAIRAHGGTIQCRNLNGAGFTICITIPASRLAA